MATPATLICNPGGALTGRIRVPGDKSITHRAILLGAIADGATVVEGGLLGEDCLCTLAAFRAMGVGIALDDQGAIRIVGQGREGLSAPRAPLDLGNSGTGMRLLAGLLAGQLFPATLVGDPSLSRRPMRRILEPLRRMGADIAATEAGTPPLQIRPVPVLQGIDYDLPVASAQVKSCTLLAGLYARGRTRVREPAPTRDHTERMLRLFGCPVTTELDGWIALAGGVRLSGQRLRVPADLSSAAFFLVGASIAPGSDLLLEGVGINPSRAGIIDILRRMGADIRLLNERQEGSEPVADLRVVAAPLHGIEVPPALVPLAIDEFPALFVAAACAEGVTRITGAEELRVKESDRIAGMATGLQALGVAATPTADGCVIHGGGPAGGGQGGVAPLHGGTVDSLGDHRLAMSFAMAGLRADGPIRILDCANIATSFPGFVPLARRAGLDLAEVAP